MPAGLKICNPCFFFSLPKKLCVWRHKVNHKKIISLLVVHKHCGSGSSGRFTSGMNTSNAKMLKRYTKTLYKIIEHPRPFQTAFSPKFKTWLPACCAHYTTQAFSNQTSHYLLIIVIILWHALKKIRPALADLFRKGNKGTHRQIAHPDI